jgi:hypothetical protein
MADGSTKRIELVRVGDVVWGSDPVTGVAGGRVVTDLLPSDGVKRLVTLTVVTRVCRSLR